jgi:purine-binding chemotaxis protein CheW
MEGPVHILAFEIEGRHYGLPLDCTLRVVQAVDCPPLPGAPESVSGICDFHGQIVPVFNLRHKLGFGPRVTSASDHFIIAKTKQRTVAVTVDAISGIVTPRSSAITKPQDVIGEVDQIVGVTRLDNDLLLIYDLDRFLFSDEEAALDSAITSVRS